jgi:hypothetical protein
MPGLLLTAHCKQPLPLPGLAPDPTPALRTSQQQVEGSALSSTMSGSPTALEDAAAGAALEEVQWGAGMRDAELLVWMGDFNYR